MSNNFARHPNQQMPFTPNQYYPVAPRNCYSAEIPNRRTGSTFISDIEDEPLSLYTNEWYEVPYDEMNAAQYSTGEAGTVFAEAIDEDSEMIDPNDEDEAMMELLADTEPMPSYQYNDEHDYRQLPPHSNQQFVEHPSLSDLDDGYSEGTGPEQPFANSFPRPPTRSDPLIHPQSGANLQAPGVITHGPRPPRGLPVSNHMPRGGSSRRVPQLAPRPPTPRNSRRFHRRRGGSYGFHTDPRGRRFRHQYGPPMPEEDVAPPPMAHTTVGNNTGGIQTNDMSGSSNVAFGGGFSSNGVIIGNNHE